MQALTDAQLKVMEIDMRESNATTKRRCTIMDKATLLDKGIHIPKTE
jgi:transposase